MNFSKSENIKDDYNITVDIYFDISYGILYDIKNKSLNSKMWRLL